VIIIKKSNTLPQNTPQDFMRGAYAENTHKAYRNDMDHFIAWGGKIPTSPETITQYLSDHAETLSLATLRRRISTIGKAHKLIGHPNPPTQSEAVRMTLRGIARCYRKPQKQAAPLIRDDLVSIVSQMPHTATSFRDKAILLIGFAGALRRSEIVNLNLADITLSKQGAVLIIRHSKTDQYGIGRKVSIPYARGRICPVLALIKWTKTLNQDQGPLFTSIRKGHHITGKRLSDRTISTLIKAYAQKVQLNPHIYSGHSLRAGFCTTAAQMNVPEWKIMKQTGHKSHQTLLRYIREGRLFEDSAVLGMF